MCGITGFIDNKINYEAKFVAQNMGRLINYRGPDSNGIWQDNDLGINLVHQRLAILDLSTAGHQPMISISGRYVMTFNGEIYNHSKIKLALEAKLGPIVWHGHSDTEAILMAFEVYGVEDTLARMEGMFAIALWDRDAQSIYLIRDRMGEKPLYYGYFSGVFTFSSELKALQAHPKFDPKLNQDAISQFVMHSCIPAPLSIFEGIYKLRPGHLFKLSYRDYINQCLPESLAYWSLTDATQLKYEGSQNQAVDDLEAILKSVVSEQALADVPIGCFLSGGVDSSLIAAIMQDVSRTKVNTFSIGFDNPEYNEAEFAKEVARHLGTNHTELYVSEQDALKVIPKIATIYDEPFSDSSQIVTYLVSEIARSKVTVALSGDGGDELFAGYNRYLLAERMFNKLNVIPGSMRFLLGKLVTLLGVRSLNLVNKIVKFPLTNIGDKLYKFESLINVKNFEEFYLNLIRHWSSKGIVSGLENDCLSLWLKEISSNFGKVRMMQYLDTLGYLPDDILTKVDRAAMAVSLETRVPLLNHRIVEFAFSLPPEYMINNGASKWPLRQVLYKHVPMELIERPKRGFAVPLNQWLRGDELKDWSFNLLDTRRLSEQGYFNAEVIQRKLNNHMQGKEDNGVLLWDILMFQQWLDTWKRKS